MKKKFKVMAFTAIAMGITCSFIVPKTNSKYYIESGFNDRETLNFGINLYRLYDATTSRTLKPSLSDSSEDNKVNVEYSIPLRTNLGEDVVSDKISIIPSNNKCEVISINGNNIAEIDVNGLNKREIPIVLSCDASNTSSEPIDVLGLPVVLDSTLTTEVDIQVNEKINDVEEFTYLNLSGTFTKSSNSSNVEKTITTSDFDEFRKWILAYAYKYENENIETILTYINNTGTTSLEEVKNIKGIKVNGDTYSIEPNFVGYAKTENSFNETNTKIEMFFTGLENETEFNKVFNEYINNYFYDKDATETTNDANKKAAIELISKISINGYTGAYALFKTQTDNTYLISKKDSMILYKNNLTNIIIPVDYNFNLRYDELVNIAFPSLLQKSKPFEILSDTEKQEIAKTILHNFGFSDNRLYHYLSYNNKPTIDYTKTRYFIYYMTTKVEDSLPKNKYLLLKIVPKDSYFEIHVNDLDVAIDQGSEGIFNYQTGEELYINILNSTSDASNKTIEVKEKIDGYLGVTTSTVSELKTYNQYSFQHITYDASQTTAADEPEEDESKTMSTLNISQEPGMLEGEPIVVEPEDNTPADDTQTSGDSQDESNSEDGAKDKTGLPEFAEVPNIPKVEPEDTTPIEGAATPVIGDIPEDEEKADIPEEVEEAAKIVEKLDVDTPVVFKEDYTGEPVETDETGINS